MNKLFQRVITLPRLAERLQEKHGRILLSALADMAKDMKSTKAYLRVLNVVFDEVSDILADGDVFAVSKLARFEVSTYKLPSNKMIQEDTTVIKIVPKTSKVFKKKVLERSAKED